jgi:hypothetical protein
MDELMKNGIMFETNFYTISIRTVVCDTVEKAALLKIKGYSDERIFNFYSLAALD